jgi:hypothetical protein
MVQVSVPTVTDIIYLAMGYPVLDIVDFACNTSLISQCSGGKLFLFEGLICFFIVPA